MHKRIYILCFILVFHILLLSHKAIAKDKDLIIQQPISRLKYRKEFRRPQIAAENFVRMEFLMENGGIRTKFKEEGYTIDYATGNDVLSESIGLMMRYAVQIDDKELFKLLLRFTEEKLSVDNIISYRNSNVFGIFKVNAVIDDFRIIRALNEAGQKFDDPNYISLANMYANRLYDTNVSQIRNSGNELIDFYSTEHQYQNDYLTLCYADFITMSQLAKDDPRWLPVYEKSLDIVKKGYISDTFPFYASNYNYKSQTYDKSYIVTTQSLLTMIHLAETGYDLDKSIKFIKELIEDKSLFIHYDKKGKPLDNNFATANYALASILGSIVGDKDLQYIALTKMKEFQIDKKDSPIFGGFGNIKTNESFSFDNLYALLALQAMEVVHNQKIKNSLKKYNISIF